MKTIIIIDIVYRWCRL